MKNDGGPAFPNTSHKPCSCGLRLEITGHGGGMSLRDYFAAAALTGMIACPSMSDSTREGYAIAAFEYADAMLKEREKDA